MGGISSSGLVSGIDTQSIITQLLSIESRPKIFAQQRIVQLQTQQAAYLDVNSQLLALRTSAGAMRFNRVFDQTTFDDLRSQLWARAQAGATALAVQNHVKVYGNPHYGVPDGEVDILWFYLNPVQAWWNSLSDWVKAAVDLEPWNYLSFPNYGTVLQLHLDNRQVNLLAHLTSWNVASTTRVGGLPSNEETVRTFLNS